MEISCVKCKIVDKICRRPDEHGPKFCPTLTKKDIIEKALKEYDKPGVMELARQSSIQEGECYLDRDAKTFILRPSKSRVQEIMEFCWKMGYQKLAVVYCGPVTHKASLLTEILEINVFELVAISCKFGAVDKQQIGLKQEQKINISANHESMNNPIAQALVLNDTKTDFNIMLCLCVGHNSMFLMYIEAPTTVFAAKDRVTGHNPLAALYTGNS